MVQNESVRLMVGGDREKCHLPGDYAAEGGQGQEPWASRLTPVASVREILTQHLEKILILPAGRRIPVAALLGHLDVCQLDSCPHQWASLACEIGFEEAIDPAAAGAPWSAPHSSPCWQGVLGPVFHVWVSGKHSERRQLFGLIVPDQRASLHVTEIVWLLGEEEKSSTEHRPELAAPRRSAEAVLSDLVVESAACPSLPAADPRLTALSKPAGEGWLGQWWKRGPRDQWQYGWWRWREG